MQAVDDDGSEKTTQQSNKETRGDDKEHSKGEGKRESDTSIFFCYCYKIILLGQHLDVPLVESILILKLGHRRCCAERVGVVKFS